MRLLTVRAAKGFLAGVLVSLSVSCGSPAAPVAVATVVVTPASPALHSLGETLQLDAVAKDADGNVIEGRDVTWTSDAPSVLAITGRSAEAKAPGQATITATIDGISGSTKVTVEQVVASIAIAPAEVHFQSLGEVSAFTATPKDARGNPVAGKVLAWSSSVPAVAAVNTSGGVMAVANGQTTVTASVDGVSATGPVIVAQVPAKLSFATAPVTTQNGVTMPAVKVEIQDARGNRVAGATNQVSIALAANPGAGALSGTKLVSAVNGVATFTTLAVDQPGVPYAFSAEATDLSGATSPAFEIMDVPMRFDSVSVAPTIKVSGSATYTAWITNGEGKNATGVALQAYIVQGKSVNAAGGSSVFSCGPAVGVASPGTCKVMLSYNSTGGSLALGAATARFDLQEGQILRGMKTIAVTIVP